MPEKNIVIIGADDGGATAALSARSFNPHAHICLIDEKDSALFSQLNPGEYLQTEQNNWVEQSKKQEAVFKQHFNIDIRFNCRATSLDMETRCLIVSERGQLKRLPFSTLIFAEQAVDKQTTIAGLSGKRVVHFRKIEDVEAIKKAVAAGAKKIAVLGCGLYGIQAAVALKSLNLDVTIIERSQRILPDFSLFLANRVKQSLRTSNIELLLGEQVKQAFAVHDGFSLHTSSGAVVNADLVVLATGSEANTTLLAEAGVALQDNRCLRVDENMQTTLPGIFACGSSVSLPQVLSNARMWLPLQGTIERTAQIAGQNASLESKQEFSAIKPMAGIHQLRMANISFARSGLNESDARRYCAETFFATVHSKLSEKWQTKKEMSIRLMVSVPTRQILGAEIWGSEGVDRRIDLLSLAITEKWPIDRLMDIEMSFATNHGPGLDPLKEAAHRAIDFLRSKANLVSAETVALWLAQKKIFSWLHVGTPKIDGLPSLVKAFELESISKNTKEIALSSAPVIISSNSGRTARIAEQILTNKGFKNVLTLDGGLTSWRLLMSN